MLQNWNDSTLMCTEGIRRRGEQNDLSTARNNFVQAKKQTEGREKV
jgi:hypothetical protein